MFASEPTNGMRSTIQSRRRSCDCHDLPIGHRLQVCWGQLEDCVGRSSRSPEDVVLQERVVNERGYPLAVSKRWHATNRKAGVQTHKVGAGFLDGFASEFAQPALIHPIGAAYQSQQRSLALELFEDQRFHDLFEPASKSLGCLFRRSRRSGQFHHLMRKSLLPQDLLKSLGTGTQLV
jgi:hypothetical protein